MKREAKERLCRMLEADKEELNEESRAAALCDFTRVAKEYFETDGDLSLQAVRVKGGTEVKISFRATRVKNFSALK